MLKLDSEINIVTELSKLGKHYCRQAGQEKKGFKRWRITFENFVEKSVKEASL